MDATETQPEMTAAAPPENANDLILTLEGFEGPIDLLLSLAREQKLDLSNISILALAEQYLTFVDKARKVRLELAADYLVMAAWLAFLKSRLLLPDPPKDEPNPADMAEALKFQLLRLEAMQKAAAALHEQPQLDRDVFLRGLPPVIEVEVKPTYYLPLYDLLSALAAPLRRRPAETYNIKPRRLFSLEESVGRLRRLLGGMPNWTVLHSFMPDISGEEPMEARSAIASTFAATLELVKAGELELRQDETFAPIYIRKRDVKPEALLEEKGES